MAALAVAAPAAGRVTAALVTTVMGDADAPAGTPPLLPLEQARRDVERRMVSAALSRHPARADAARALGLSRQGLEKAMRRLGLAVVRPRAGVA
jgi:transcriptional regulator with GAF, ATPase, and Fis domain